MLHTTCLKKQEQPALVIQRRRCRIADNDTGQNGEEIEGLQVRIKDEIERKKEIKRIR